jgi:YHS domain-containing protein
MRYALAFLASFAIVAGITAFARVSSADETVADATPQHKEEKKDDTPKKEDKEGDKKDDMGGHEGHDMGDKEEDGEKKEDAEKSEWGGEVKTDLKNETDPVSGDEVGDSEHHVVYHGFKVHFSEEKSIRKFKRRPIQFLATLELERTKDGEVNKVDPDDFKDPPIIPDTCPMMGGDIWVEDGVYIFHRGYKIYFCCWNGCADDFLAAPEKHYAVYGLEEKDGELVPKEEE